MTPALQSAAAQFLARSDFAYTECSQGILRLNTILVSTHSSFVADTRGYLVPIVYAYWERFFRIVFHEYLLAISSSGIEVGHLCDKLARLRWKWELKETVDRGKAKSLDELCFKLSSSDIQATLMALAASFRSPADFAAKGQWVETHSNVGVLTLKENCEKFGLDFSRLEQEFVVLSLGKGLKNLVDARNDVAHGGKFRSLTSAEWQELVNFVLKLMATLQSHLYDNVNEARSELIASFPSGSQPPPDSFEFLSI